MIGSVVVLCSMIHFTESVLLNPVVTHYMLLYGYMISVIDLFATVLPNISVNSVIVICVFCCKVLLFLAL